MIIDSSQAGHFEIYASASVEVVDREGFIEVTTDGNIPNSGPATKTFVDAKIGFSPDAVNVVDNPHPFTVTVMVDHGNGDGFVDAAAGETVVVTLTTGVGSIIPGGTCPTTDDFGKCTVVINSDETGQSTLHATVALSVDGVDLVRATGSGAPNSADAVKTWVNADIRMDTPSTIQEVEGEITFTITVEDDNGSGGDPTPTNGTLVTITVPPGVTILANTCETAGTEGGTCTVTVTSDSPDTYTITATADVTVGGKIVSVSTESTVIFVDATIALSADAANVVDNAHTFIVTVMVDDGTGGGLVAAAAGETVTVTLDGVGSIIPGGTCPTTNSFGQCTVVINSGETGKSTLHAGVNMIVNTVDLSRQTDPDAVKTWVNARISMVPESPINAVSVPRTFTVTVLADNGTELAPTNGTLVTIAAPGGVSITDNNCATPGTLGGTCTFTATSNSPGIYTITATTVVEVSEQIISVSTQGTASFVDARITVTPDGANPIGEPYRFTVLVQQNIGSGWDPVPGVVYPTYTLHNGGGASGALTNATSDTCFSAGTVDGSCYVTIVSPTAGITTIHVETSLTVSGVPLSRQTDPDGVVTWVNASISITPNSAINAVGEPHTFTVTVSADPSGGHPNFLSITPSVNPNQLSQNGSTCDNPTVVDTYIRTCEITINSSVPGVYTISAAAEVKIKGVNLVLAPGDHGGYPNATKTCVDASATIGPDAVNPVGQSHDFTIIVMPDAPAGTTIDSVLITPTGDTGFITGNDCAEAAVVAALSCTVTVKSDVPASASIGAEVVLVFSDNSSGDTATVSLSSGSATVHWVDAYIGMENPEAIQVVDDQYTFIINVSADDGSGYGPSSTDDNSVTIDVPFGVTIEENTCATATGTVNGTCTVTVTSTDPGTYTITATADVVVLGETISVRTVGTVIFVDASMTIGPDGVNPVGQPHTFTINVMPDAPAGTTLNSVLITPTGDTGFITGNDCAEAAVVAALSCTVTVNSNAPASASIGAFVDVRFTNGSNDTATVSFSGSPSTKHWVDASVTIGPDGVNAVGQSHDFIITVTPDAPEGTTLASVSITPTGDTGLITANDCTEAAAVSALSCTVTVSSNVATLATIGGKVSMVFSDDSSSDTATVMVSTSNPGTKHWVDASVTIGPDGVNPVNAPHTFTINVTADAPDGATVSSVSITPTGDIGLMTANTCAEAAVVSALSCTVTVNSGSVGSATIGASVDVRFTNGSNDTATVSFSGSPSTKHWVDASVTIGPDGVNAVGQSHDFTITVMPDAPEGTTLDSVSITPTGDTGFITANDCAQAAAISALSCTVTVNSGSFGLATIGAKVSMAFSDDSSSDTATVMVSTSNPATKHWVNASVTIGPDGLNPVNAPHTFTINVTADAPDGATVSSVSITPTGDIGLITANTCAEAAVVSALSCTVTVNSGSVGSATIGASVVLVFSNGSTEPLTVSISTNETGSNSGPATKHWVDASVTIRPDGLHQVGESHDFAITVMTDPLAGTTLNSVSITPTGDISFILTDDCDRLGAGTFLNCTVTVKSDGPASATIGANVVLVFSDESSTDTATVSVSTSSPAVATWVSTAIGVSIVADPSLICQGPVTRVTYTIRVWNEGSVDLRNVTVNHNILGDVTAEFLLVNGNNTLTSLQNAENPVEFDVTQDISSTTTNQATAQGLYPDLRMVVEAAAQATVTAIVCEISGHKYQDLLNDGPTTDDTGLLGWTINLYAADGTLTSTKTAADGSYSFTNLAEGSYLVVEVMELNWQQTFPSQDGTVGSFDVTLDPLTSAVAAGWTSTITCQLTWRCRA